MRNRTKLALSAIAISCLLPAAIAPAQAAELEAPADLPDAKAALSGELVDQLGKPLEVLSIDNSSDGEETYVVESDSGLISTVRVQYSSITEDDRQQMLADMQAPIPELESYEEAPGPETGELTPAPLDDATEWSAVTAVVASPEAVSVAWDNEDFTLQILGKTAVSSEDGVATLTDLEDSSVYDASVVSTAPASDELELVEQRSFTVATPDSSGNVQAKAYQTYTTAYVHKTFIPDNRVSGFGCTAVKEASFGGDNRSWQLPVSAEPGGSNQRYRTQMFANINWDNPQAYKFVHVKNVGATTVYLGNVLLGTRYADTSNMKFEGVQAGSNYAKAYFNHTANNPGCILMGVSPVGSIRYAEWVEYYRSGTVAVEGYRFKAPAHEMYGRLNNTWKTISRRPNEGFGCLLGNGACGLDFYNTQVS